MKLLKKILLILLAVLILLLAAVTVFFFYFAHGRNFPDLASLVPQDNPVFQSYMELEARGRTWLETQETEQVSVTSYDGLQLQAVYAPAENAKACVILMHGYRSTGLRDFGGLLSFYGEKGYSVLICNSSGHTDSVGLAIDNRALSTDRANSVLNYLLSQNNAALEPYAQYFCAAGYGATRPVASNETEQGRATNRRIEISMILKDETVLDIVDSYLAIEVPDTRSALGESEPVVAAEPQPTEEPATGFAGILNWLG